MMVGARPSWMLVYFKLPWALSASEVACTDTHLCASHIESRGASTGTEQFMNGVDHALLQQ